MSTARTAVGCMAEDYPDELADICGVYIAAKRGQEASGYVLSEDESHTLDVARNFIAAAHIRRRQ